MEHVAVFDGDTFALHAETLHAGYHSVQEVRYQSTCNTKSMHSPIITGAGRGAKLPNALYPTDEGNQLQWIQRAILYVKNRTLQLEKSLPMGVYSRNKVADIRER